MLKYFILLAIVTCVAAQYDDGSDVDPPLDKNGCGPNQFYGNAPSCDQTCSNLDQDCASVLNGDVGCYCKQGYIPNDKGRCVLGNRYCGCKINEYYTETGEICDRTCQYLNQTCDQSGDQNAISDNYTCYCLPGYSRGPKGYCVPDSICPLPNCPLHEEYLTCGICEGTCAYPLPKCDNSCKPARCYCKKDFVRSERGNCVQYFYREADPSQCKYNEELVEKGYYENTCDDPPPLETDKPFVDPKNPLPRGCYCPQPYVRIESGQCAVYARCASQQSESQQSA